LTVNLYESATEENIFQSCSYSNEGSWGVAAIYTVVVTMDGNNCKLIVHQDSNPATISILTFIPQYLVLTIAEVMVSVTGVEWAYTEAPPTMKAIVNALWVLTTCVGNLIDLVIVSLKVYS